MENLENQFKQELEEKLDKVFPKNKCKERGNALVLFAWATLFFKKYLDIKDKDWQQRCKEAKILTAEASFEAGKNQQDGLRTHFFKRRIK